MDSQLAVDQAANFRLLKNSSAFTLTSDQVQMLEERAQIEDRNAARGGDDSDQQYIADIAAWDRAFAVTLGAKSSILVADAVAQESYLARLIAGPSLPGFPIYAVYAAAPDHVAFKVPYDGQVVAVNQYPFLDVASGSASAISATSVTWLLDGVAVRTVTNAPFFDFGGTSGGSPVAWDTTAVSGTLAAPVAHQLTAIITLSNGSTQTVSATVTVTNAASGGYNVIDVIGNDVYNLYEADHTTVRAGERTDSYAAQYPHFGKHELGTLGWGMESWDFGDGGRSGPLDLASWGAFDTWGQVLRAAAGSASLDALLQIRNWRLYSVLSNFSWQKLYGGSNLADDSLAGTRIGDWTFSPTERGIHPVVVAGGSGGGYSIDIGAIFGQNSNTTNIYHFWPNDQNPRIAKPAGTIVMLVAQLEMRLLPRSNPANLPNVHIVGAESADVFFTPTTSQDYSWGNPGIGMPRHKRLRYQGQPGDPNDGWQLFTCSCITTQAPAGSDTATRLRDFLLAHPVPILT